MSHKEGEKGRNLLDTPPRDSLRQEGEIGAQIQKGVIGEEEAKRDTEITEIST